MPSHRKSDPPGSSSGPSLDERVREFERHVVEKIDVTDTQSARKAARREWVSRLKFVGAWCGLWTMLVAASLFARDAWPPDETRMLAMAWEMWSQHRFAVPLLNGEAQPLPPFFFWLVHLGWFAFGVTDGWARLVGPLGALASLFVVSRLARLLWPSEQEVARYAPLVLLGTLLFAFASSVTLPDTWTLCLVSMAYWGLLIRWRHRDMRAWLLLGVALGFGALNAGFIVWLYVLPVALLAPLWARTPRPGWKYWYVDILYATALAAVMVAVWIGIAGATHGASYVARFFTHALSGVPLTTFARTQPWWWYAWLVPAVFLPWSVLPLAWMRLWYIRREPLEDGFVFCLTWIVVSVFVLSLLPVKQVQHLLPLLPAGVLLAARLLFGRALIEVYADKAFGGMALPLLLLGGVQMALPRLPRVEFLPEFLWEQSPWLGVAIMAIGIATAWLPLNDVHRRVFDIAGMCVLLMVLALLGIASQFNSLYPLADVGRVLGEAQARGQPVAYVGDYQGEFHFAGRLRAPLAVVGPAHAEAWLNEHPQGVLVAYSTSWAPRIPGQLPSLLDVPFRDQRLRVFGIPQSVSVPGAGR